MNSESELKGLIEKIKDDISNIVFLYDEETLEKYQENTTSISHKVLGVFLPNSEEEVQRIVCAAKKRQFAIHPISKGHNWGYGGRTPYKENCFVLDLSKMNEIIDLDHDSAVVTLQPGVTSQQLYEYFKDHNLPYYVPTIGAGGNVSLVGNALERGFGLSAYKDHFSAVTALRVVLADGSIYVSSIVAENMSLSCYKWGVGPYIDGIFSQSNLGVVTQMSIKLRKKYKKSYIVTSYIDEKNFESIVSVIKDFLQEYPPDSTSFLLMDKERYNSSARVEGSNEGWVLFSIVNGQDALAKFFKKDILKRVKKFSRRSIVISNLHISLLKKIKNIKFISKYKNVKASLESLIALFDIATGKPNHTILKNLAYSLVKPHRKVDLNPDEDQVGLLWAAPLLPLRPREVSKFKQMVAQIFAQHNMKCCVSFTFLSHNCIDATLPIIYDKSNPEEVERAQKCYHALMAECMKRGFVPYRVGIQGMHHIVDKDKVFWQTALKIKKALDPDNIISPSRYALDDEVEN